MFCANCGTQLETGAVFCPNCGAKVGESAEGAATSGSAQAATNVHLEKAKNISKGYFSYFLEHIKAPIRHGFSIERANWINGLITIIIIVLFLGFTSFILSSSITRGFSALFGDIARPSFVDAFLLPVLYMGLTFAIVIGVIFLVAKLMKSEANIQDVVARFGTFMIIPTMFILLSFVLGFLRIFALVSIFSLGYMLSLVCAIVLTVYSYGKEQRGGIDAYYGILLAFLGLALAFYIFGSGLTSGLTGLF